LLQGDPLLIVGFMLTRIIELQGMKNVTKGLAAASVLLLSVACQSTTEVVSKATVEPAPPVRSKPTVPTVLTRDDFLPVIPPVREETFLTLVDGGVPDELVQTIEIRNYATRITRIEQLPEVRLDVFNRLNEEQLTFEIRTLWFREDGSIIDATEWVQATVNPRTSYPYRAMTFTDFAKREQVQIRLLQRGESEG